jgi:serine/threonine protein kinase
MPLRQEGSLTDWLQKRGKSEKLTPSEVASFVTQAAEALQHAHESHLIHQDVKPSNFLVRSRSGYALPDLLLMDFGIAKMTTATTTTTQNIRGTPAFMAPEQWRGQPQPATDQYALAIMAYLLLTGRTPFSGRMEQVMSQHFMDQPQPPSTLSSVLSPALDAVILRALEKEPEKRFPSVLAFARAFQEALEINGNLDTTVIRPKKGEAETSANTDNPDLETTKLSPPDIRVSKKVRGTKKVVWIVPSLVLLVLVASVIGGGIYQTHMNQVNASATIAANKHATSTAQAMANDPYPPAGTLALSDPLSDNSRGYRWDEATVDDGSFCRFIDGAYHAAQADPRYLHQCVAEATDFRNFTFEVQMKILKGGGGGIYFRANNISGTAYYLRILRSGTYILSFFSIYGSPGKELASGFSPAIRTDLNQTNLIAVVANRNTFDFYVNNQKIGSVDDQTYSHGEVGVTADYAPTEVVYSNAKVWTW